MPKKEEKESQTSHGKLNKNMNYIVTTVKHTKVVSLQVYVKVGSRDESDSYSGISHLLEHMIFKGSELYPTSNDIEVHVYECGGVFNAFTTQSETVYHIECDIACVDMICKIMSDVLYHSLFSGETLEIEKNVVINELNQGLSDPQNVCVQALQRQIFKGTHARPCRLAKDIGGNEKSIKGINSNILRNFINVFYKHGIVVSLVGDISKQDGTALLKKYFPEVPTYECKRLSEIHKDSERETYPNQMMKRTSGDIEYVYTKDTSEHSFIEVAYPAVAYDDIKGYYILLVISELLTGYLGIGLYQVLRNKHGLIYHIDSSIDVLEDIGVLYISCSCKNAKDIVRQTVQLLTTTVKDTSKDVNKRKLSTAKKNILATMKLSTTDVHSIGVEHAQDLVYLDKVISESDKRKHINSITLQDIQDMADKIFQDCYGCVSYTGSQKYMK